MYIYILKLLHVDSFTCMAKNCHNRSVFGCLGTISGTYKDRLLKQKLLEQEESDEDLNEDELELGGEKELHNEELNGKKELSGQKELSLSGEVLSREKGSSEQELDEQPKKKMETA